MKGEPSRKEIIEEMQLCLACSPHFDKEKHILAHRINMHVYVKDGNEMLWGSTKKKYSSYAQAKERAERIY